MAALRGPAEALLRSGGQVFFSESRLAGALVLAAAFSQPWGGLLGVLAAAFAVSLARAWRFSEEAANRGLFGFNALFLGLGVGAWFEPGLAPLLLLAVAVPVIVLTQVGLATALSHTLGLPPMTLPFVMTAHLVLLTSPLISGLAPANHHVSECALPLASAGAVLFAPGPVGGALALASIAVASRVGLGLAALGLVAAEVATRTLTPCTTVGPELAFNALLTAMALGGVWFVPSRSAFVLAFGAALVASFLTVALGNLTAIAGLPVLVLPFNLTTLAVLFALRQRSRNAAPVAVDVPAATPEATLSRQRAREARLGATLPVRLSLPFQGTWTVTQGVDGPHTHQGPWRHALDFEVLDRDGQSHRNGGSKLSDYHAFRLPVLAPADGRVVRVVRDADDHPPGERSPQDPWGNLVLLEVAPACFALLCHLARDSVEVEEGQRVKRGARLGLCGASGRSFVPHLHLHLQATAQTGAPTLDLELHDVVEETDAGPVLYRTRTPREGARVRNPLHQEDVAACFAWGPGTAFPLAVTGPDVERREALTVAIDLYNTLSLTSGRGERLPFEQTPWLFALGDAPLRPDGALALFAVALRRVPWEAGHGLVWEDRVPRALLDRPGPLKRWLSELSAPLWAPEALSVRYSAERTASGLVVRGEAPDLVTEAEVDARGVVSLAVTWRGVTRRAARVARVAEGAQ